MFEPFKISRVLPPHELNARRARKRVLPQPPPVSKRPVASDTFHDPAIPPTTKSSTTAPTHHPPPITNPERLCLDYFARKLPEKEYFTSQNRQT